MNESGTRGCKRAPTFFSAIKNWKFAWLARNNYFTHSGHKKILTMQSSMMPDAMFAHASRLAP